MADEKTMMAGTYPPVQQPAAGYPQVGYYSQPTQPAPPVGQFPPPGSDGVITIQQQPVAQIIPIQAKQFVENDTYRIPLFGCMSNPVNCLLAWLCPCIPAYRAAVQLGENGLYGCCCGTLPLNVRFRTIVGIKEDMCMEGFEYTFCNCCFTLRLVNEMDARNFAIQRS